MLEVGRVVRPHGLKGQVVVELWTNVEGRLAPGARLRSAGGDLVVAAASRLGGAGGRWPRWLVTFAGVASREAADGLREAVLLAEPRADEGVLWVHEMVGEDLYDSGGERVGTVEAVEAGPASDLLVLADGRVIPLTFVSRTAGGRLTVDGPEGLLEL